MRARERSDAGALLYGGIPRANLMPPEVAQRRRASAQRRALIALGALVTAIVIAGVVASYLYAGAAEQRLAEERRITDQLLATQLEYTEVTQIRADIQTIGELRTELGAIEVLWADVLAPYLTALDDGSEVSAVTVLGDQPGQPPLGTAGPLRAERVAEIRLVITTDRVPTPWVWIRAWELLDTFADASIDRITLNQGSSYDVAITINLDADALSQRFTAGSAAGTDDSEQSNEEGDQ